MRNRPPFPEVIDNTLLSAFRSCPQKAWLDYFCHWKPKDPSVHLHAGKAYASGLETARKAYYEDLKSSDDAIVAGLEALLLAYGNFDCPETSPKSATRMAGALEYYFDQYPLDSDRATPLVLPDGKRAVEFGGVEPLSVCHPETGNPLLYSWRMDMACDYEGMKLGEDDKTTSSLGASWPKQWDLRSQFTGYVWGAAQHGIKLDGFLVRGVSILKTKYDTMQCITYRPEWQIDRWYAQVERDLLRMIQCWESGYFDYNLADGCAEYGGCQFRNVCLSPSPEAMMGVYFSRRKWNPVTREEEEIQDEIPLS